MKKILTGILFLFTPLILSSQENSQTVSGLITEYKSDIRGPYKDIRWYCPDGSIVLPNERCPEPGGVQRARYKDEVVNLGKSNHIFLGQILSTTPNNEFWDKENYYSRLKQYQLEKYLKAIDDGWILRKAQFYRGAYQAEDEEQWGINFFQWLLSDNINVQTQFFLIREALKDIPHKGDDNLKQNVRLLSKEISDSYTPFTNIRVKIHGQPDQSDVKKVKEFIEKNKSKMSEEQLSKASLLIKEMEKLYQPFDIQSINLYTSTLPRDIAIYNTLKIFQQSYKNTSDDAEKILLLSNTLFEIRTAIVQQNSAETRFSLFDVSIILEDLLFKVTATYTPTTILEQINLIRNLGIAATGCGYIEIWEWGQLKTRINPDNKEEVSEDELYQLFDACRRITEWGTGMFMATYKEVVMLFNGFEPLSSGFVDEKVRSSILLKVGIAVNNLGENISQYLPFTNQIMGLQQISTSRGLNSGYSKGELVVVQGNTDEIEFDKNKIYVFGTPPSDLKPVSGIVSVSEGNPVSHIQLLARNLGIPNAVISLQTFEELKAYAGQTVFYAVSSKGVIVMKPENEMTTIEKQLFETKKREETKVTVPTDKIKLDTKQVIDLSEVNATASGSICGPKAANLGQLKEMYPGNVVNGLVIPFAAFRQHLNQEMPGKNMSYWEYLNTVFDSADKMKTEGKSEADIEIFMLAELKIISDAIKDINLSDEFSGDLEKMFLHVFGKEIGNIPVFLRSDTNMEDLKEFTGAGLNLTLFNVLTKEAILQGIREVWASPYTERSYKWRQRYLTNPENVFPSILIIPSVDVDYSGVVITKGLITSSIDDVTMAFSRGAGGAVDGQVAELYQLNKNGTSIMLSPAREPILKTLPSSGGVKNKYTSFNLPILNQANITELRSFTNKLKKELPDMKGIETQGPFDIELGFKDDKLWLFQVRPFVENKNAASQLYLESLNPVLDSDKFIKLN